LTYNTLNNDNNVTLSIGSEATALDPGRGRIKLYSSGAQYSFIECNNTTSTAGIAYLTDVTGNIIVS
jgi:hypothetical protein